MKLHGDRVSAWLRVVSMDEHWVRVEDAYPIVGAPHWFSLPIRTEAFARCDDAPQVGAVFRADLELGTTPIGGIGEVRLRGVSNVEPAQWAISLVKREA